MTSLRDACDFCGLPVPASWWNRGDDADQRGDEPRYCCYGCRFAAAVTQERNEAGAVRWTLTRLGIAIFFTMNVMVFTMALWTQDVYGADPNDALAGSLAELFRYICLICSLPVLFLLGVPLADNALGDLRRRVLSTDLLLVTGVAAAYVYSGISVFRGEGHIYFEVGCMVLVMVTLGRWLEAAGRLQATTALDDLEKLLPESVRLVDESGERAVPLKTVTVDQTLRVLPGERFPTDGWIINEFALVDEQVLTGEMQPVEKCPGDAVLAGTLNLDGDVKVTVTAAPGCGSFQRLIDFVRQARLSKGRYQRLADRLAAWFFPVMGTLSLATLLFHGLTKSWESGLLAGLSVVLIACPCALGLATPLAVWAAMGRSAREHVLFQHGLALERLAGVRAIRFDKTGTLTTGDLPVAEFVGDGDRIDALQRAAALARSSRHALCAAILDFIGDDLPPLDAQAVRSVAGRGVTARLAGETEPTYLGNLRFLQENGLEESVELRQRAETADASMTYIGWGGRIRGMFLFDEVLRAEARDALVQLRGAGYDVAVLTGDHRARGEKLARELSVNVRADLLPEDKLAVIYETQRRVGPVAMVGDGINDAPALAAADVGIAMGCGADVSRDAAAVCLLGNDLSQLPRAMQLAKQTVRVIRQNLFWAVGYNTIGVGLACAGMLNPVWAALLMAASSFFVISNSLRLRGTDHAAIRVTTSSETEHHINEQAARSSTALTADALTSV